MRPYILPLALTFFLSTASVAINSPTYVVSYADRTLIKVDDTGSEQTIQLPKDPEIVVTKDDRAYMLTSSYVHDPIRPSAPDGIKRTLSAIDLKDLSISGEVQLDHEPSALVLTDQHAFVANFSGASVSVHALADLSKTQEIKVGKLPIAMELKGDLLYILCQECKSLQVVKKDTLETLHKIDLGTPPQAFCFSGTMAYVLCKDHAVVVVDLKDHSIINRIPVGKKPSGMALTQDHLIVISEEDHTLTSLSLTDPTVTHTQSTGRKPIKVMAKGRFLYILNQLDASLTIHDAKTLNLVAVKKLDFTPSDLHLTPLHIYVDGHRLCPKYPIPEQIHQLLVHDQYYEYAIGTKLFSGFSDAQIIKRRPDGSLAKPLTDVTALDSMVRTLYPQSTINHDTPKGHLKLLTALAIYLYTDQTHYARVALRGLIELGDAYACALGVLAYKHDLWGAKANSQWVTDFSPIAHTKTIDHFEKTLPGFYESVAPYLQHTFSVIKEIVLGR